MNQARLLDIINMLLYELDCDPFRGICEHLRYIYEGQFKINQEEYFEMEDKLNEFKNNNMEMVDQRFGGTYWFQNKEQRLFFLQKFKQANQNSKQQ